MHWPYLSSSYGLMANVKELFALRGSVKVTSFPIPGSSNWRGCLLALHLAAESSIFGYIYQLFYCGFESIYQSGQLISQPVAVYIYSGDFYAHFSEISFCELPCSWWKQMLTNILIELSFFSGFFFFFKCKLKMIFLTFGVLSFTSVFTTSASSWNLLQILIVQGVNYCCEQNMRLYKHNNIQRLFFCSMRTTLVSLTQQISWIVNCSQSWSELISHYPHFYIKVSFVMKELRVWRVFQWADQICHCLYRRCLCCTGHTTFSKNKAAVSVSHCYVCFVFLVSVWLVPAFCSSFSHFATLVWHSTVKQQGHACKTCQCSLEIRL